MSELLKLKKRGHTAIITFNNPPAHTWTIKSLGYLKQLLSELNEDKDNYSLILTSDSKKFFSAGADLNQFNHDDKDQSFDSSTAFGEAFKGRKS